MDSFDDGSHCANINLIEGMVMVMSSVTEPADRVTP